MGFEQATLSGKRILITGAGRGIGRCLAMSCANLGAEVIAVDLSTRGAWSAWRPNHPTTSVAGPQM